MAPPAKATTKPLVFQEKLKGKLIIVLRAAKGWDPATRTFRDVSITFFRNGRRWGIARCAAAQWKGGNMLQMERIVSSFSSL
jgi:hypothetical protein